VNYRTKKRCKDKSKAKEQKKRARKKGEEKSESDLHLWVVWKIRVRQKNFESREVQ
jgi:hypothetical protein